MHTIVPDVLYKHESGRQTRSNLNLLSIEHKLYSHDTTRVQREMSITGYSDDFLLAKFTIQQGERV
jgi:hypothetical protein